MAGDRPPTRIGPGEHHLGVDALLLEHGQPPTAGVRGEHPLGAVVGQPVTGRRGVDAHAGQTAGGHRPDRVRIVDLSGVDTTERGDGHRGEIAERGHRLAVLRIDVGEEFVEVVGSRVRVGRHHHVGLSRAESILFRSCQPTRLPGTGVLPPHR